MARPNTKRLLPILLATAARALLPPRQHRISMRRAPPCQPKRRRTKAPNAAARTAPTRQTSALSASNDENVGKQGAVIVDAEAGFIDGAAGPAAAAAPQPTAMDAVTLVAVAAPPAKTKTKNDKKRQQAKSPQSLKVAAATIALAATAPVPTTLFAWHPALAALSLPLAAAAGVFCPASGGRGVQGDVLGPLGHCAPILGTVRHDGMACKKRASIVAM